MAACLQKPTSSQAHPRKLHMQSFSRLAVTAACNYGMASRVISGHIAQAVSRSCRAERTTTWRLQLLGNSRSFEPGGKLWSSIRANAASVKTSRFGHQHREINARRSFAAVVEASASHPEDQKQPSSRRARRVRRPSPDGHTSQNSAAVANGSRPPPPARDSKVAKTTRSITSTTTEAVESSSSGAPRVYSTDMRNLVLDNTHTTSILSWNVAGLRALLRKDPDAIAKLVEAERPDVICLQETKLQNMHVEGIETALQLGDLGYTGHWRCAMPPSRLGYSGVAVLVRDGAGLLGVDCEAIVCEEADPEGRVVTAELEDFYVVCVYVPNSGSGLKRLGFRTDEWDDAFARYLGKLGETKPVVLAGDLNVAHRELDLHSPKTNLKSAGFTKEERDSFERNLLTSLGLSDTFRRQHPDVAAYSYWSYMRKAREKNNGWRIDYTLVSEELQERCLDSFILPHVMGSDHCPVGLVLGRKSEAN